MSFILDMDFIVPKKDVEDRCNITMKTHFRGGYVQLDKTCIYIQLWHLHPNGLGCM